MENKALAILKKYASGMKVDDYQLLKKELKLLQTYRKHMSLYNNHNTIVYSEFAIDNSDEDFDYFLKNEVLKEEQ